MSWYWKDAWHVLRGKHAIVANYQLILDTKKLTVSTHYRLPGPGQPWRRAEASVELEGTEDETYFDSIQLESEPHA